MSLQPLSRGRASRQPISPALPRQSLTEDRGRSIHRIKRTPDGSPALNLRLRRKPSKIQKRRLTGVGPVDPELQQRLILKVRGRHLVMPVEQPKETQARLAAA